MDPYDGFGLGLANILPCIMTITFQVNLSRMVLIIWVELRNGRASISKGLTSENRRIGVMGESLEIARSNSEEDQKNQNKNGNIFKSLTLVRNS
jgi:hypothetical protein